MVDVRFVKRVQHPVRLADLKALAAGSLDVPYLTSAQVQAVKEMYLLSRGRLSTFCLI
jgi:hypothetical protein